MSATHQVDSTQKPPAEAEPVEKLVNFIQGKKEKSVNAEQKMKQKKTKQQKIRQEIDEKLKMLEGLNKDLLEVILKTKQVQNQINQFKGTQGRNKQEKTAAAHKRLNDLNKRKILLEKEIKEIFSIMKALNPSINLQQECSQLTAVIELLAAKVKPPKVAAADNVQQAKPVEKPEKATNDEAKDVMTVNPEAPSDLTQLYKMVDGKMIPIQLKMNSPQIVPTQVEKIINIPQVQSKPKEQETSSRPLNHQTYSNTFEYKLQPQPNMMLGNMFPRVVAPQPLVVTSPVMNVAATAPGVVSYYPAHRFQQQPFNPLYTQFQHPVQNARQLMSSNTIYPQPNPMMHQNVPQMTQSYQLKNASDPTISGVSTKSNVLPEANLSVKVEPTASSGYESILVKNENGFYSLRTDFAFVTENELKPKTNDSKAAMLNDPYPAAIRLEEN